MSLKERIRRDRLRPPHQKGPFAYVARKIFPRKTIPNRHISIFLNRYCNLKCYSCAALGMNPEPAETTLADIAKFLEHMKSFKPGSTIMVTGGEPTMSPDLESVTTMIRDNGFKSAMLTNGLTTLFWTIME